jgi:hypothetical protein
MFRLTVCDKASGMPDSLAVHNHGKHLQS